MQLAHELEIGKVVHTVEKAKNKVNFAAGLGEFGVSPGFVRDWVITTGKRVTEFK